jgi:hypothetical protein
MKRDTVINILLIIAGIVLAIVLFGAGAVWKGKVQPTRPSVLSALRPERQWQRLSRQQMQELAVNYGAASPPGRYWYDSMSGMWGYEGREASGFIRPAMPLARSLPALRMATPARSSTDGQRILQAAEV